VALGIQRVEAKLETINKRVDTLEKSIKSSN
jgi:chaperonin cofactor prefoldin